MTSALNQLVVRIRKGEASLFQAECGPVVHFLRKVMRISSISARAIYRLIEFDERANPVNNSVVTSGLRVSGALVGVARASRD